MWRIFAPCLPQISQTREELLSGFILSFEIDRYDNQFACTTQFGNHTYWPAINRLPTDDVFPLTSMVISLPLDNFPVQDSSFNVENREAIIVHLFFGVKSHHILSCANPLSHLT